jgi:starch phosphorylase
MANLATVGSHSINGVAAIHSELVKTQLLPDFAEFWPERFNNKTNGVTPRRWLLSANSLLADAITKRIGHGWETHLDRLDKLEAYVDDPELHEELRSIKRRNKERLGKIVNGETRIVLDPDSIFDVQVKRFHEYKRQLLNCLHIVALYRDLKKNPSHDVPPRTFVFGGKAAPGYRVAKLHIKLINDVARTINEDRAMHDRLRVVFIPNYGVTLAERIIPAADVSEQISMAGKEASGTGNMKFAMNGALTVGTLDGANIEIREAVGPENFFLFGLDADQVKALKTGGYRPAQHIDRSPNLGEVLEMISSGFFSPDDPERYRSLVEHLYNVDTYLTCADFDDYVACQKRVSAAYRDKEAWARAVVRNIAHTGRFSSDRTIAEYAKEIWHADPAEIEIAPYVSAPLG